MRRRGLGLALAAAIGVIALSLLGGAAAGDSGGSAGLLTHLFPLGTQTLSRSTTAAAGGSPSRAVTSTTAVAGGSPSRAVSSTTTSHRASAATLHRPAAAAPATRTSTHAGIFPLALLGLIPVLIAVALLSRVGIRRSRRLVPRDRREISPALVPLLGPLFRYDQARYAWVLRGIGRWFGPVLLRRPPARLRRRSSRITRSAGRGFGWSYERELEDEIERGPPPLPISEPPTVSRAIPAAGPSAKPHTPREQ